MKDIDFDELDKAVNSLMATAPVTPAADDIKPETTLEVPSQPTTTVEATPAAEAVSTPAETVVVNTPSISSAPSSPATAVTPAVKRSGRFMDMVHTSSDMKPRPVTAAPSREGLSVTPRPQSATPTATSSDKPAVSSSVETQTDKTPDVMPDPIDMDSSLETSDVVPIVTPEIEPTTQPAAMAESPFIADAKVEKRPLNSEGSPSVPSFDSQLASELEADAASEQEAKEPTETVTDEPPVTPQIPELNSDLVAIESSDKLEEPVVTQSIETKDVAGAVEAAATPLGATSIAKQYKTQPSSGDQSHAAIYDASEYPEPVAHPAKKKSGWLWVLWVVLLLGVGAGAAVALYFMGIIP